MDYPVFQCVSPVFFCRDLGTALPYYVGKLGFTLKFQMGEPATYAIVSRDEVEIHLMRSLDERAGKGNCYVFVAGVDEIFEQMEDAGAHVMEPIGDQIYGMRDFQVADLDGNLLAFGESTSESEG
jgi:uncharacterized glyoxalase superfamily protein PhnB